MKLKLALLATILVLSASTVEAQQVKRTLGMLRQNVENCALNVQQAIDQRFDAYVTADGVVHVLATTQASFAFDKCMNQSSTPALVGNTWKR